MDGPWQICQKTATEYGRAAKEAAKVMKWVDPSIQLAACGSSHRAMPTFGAWEYEVLEHTFEETDFLSLHMYYQNPDKRCGEFLAHIEIMDRFIKEAVSVCDASGKAALPEADDAFLRRMERLVQSANGRRTIVNPDGQSPSGCSKKSMICKMP